MDKMILMVGGHEIYLETASVNDNKAELILGYGHNMQRDGSPDARLVTTTAYTPAKEKLSPAFDTKEDYHVIKFDCEESGYYTVVADLSPMVYSNTKEEGFKEGPRNMYKDVIYAGAWHQMAKTVIAAGSPGDYTPEHLHGILDIIPKEASLVNGTDIELSLFYEGNPLANSEIKAVSASTGKEMALVATDEDGIARIPINAEGEWMFLSRHRDPSKGMDDMYDEAVFVTTLVMRTS
jgi:uncharacterized GH25 family protein